MLNFWSQLQYVKQNLKNKGEMATFPGHKDVWVSLPRSKETSENMAKVSAAVEQPGNSCQSHRVVNWWLCYARPIPLFVWNKLCKIKMVKSSRQNVTPRAEIYYQSCNSTTQNVRQVMANQLKENNSTFF